MLNMCEAFCGRVGVTGVIVPLCRLLRHIDVLGSGDLRVGAEGLSVCERGQHQKDRVEKVHRDSRVTRGCVVRVLGGLEMLSLVRPECIGVKRCLPSYQYGYSRIDIICRSAVFWFRKFVCSGTSCFLSNGWRKLEAYII